MHTEKDHASKGGVYIKDTGHRWKKKYTTNAERDACPDGKEYLSGPNTNRSSLAVGRLLLVTALSTATKMMSSTNPEIIFLFIYLNRSILSNRINFK